MPNGKPAGVRCVHLLADLRCALFGRPERPAVCTSLRPSEDMCGTTRDIALRLLAAMEIATLPSVVATSASESSDICSLALAATIVDPLSVA